MTDKEIAYLKDVKRTNSSGIAWCPDFDTFRVVKYIGPPPKAKGGDEEEPSECAYLDGVGIENGEYLALYNADLTEFIKFERMS